MEEKKKPGSSKDGLIILQDFKASSAAQWQLIGTTDLFRDNVLSLSPGSDLPFMSIAVGYSVCRLKAVPRVVLDGHGLSIAS